MKPKYEVHLCRECIKALKEFYPYKVPYEQLKIIEVPVNECDNYDIDNYDKKLLARNQ